MEKNWLLNWAVAKVIKETREAKGLTQRKLAEFACLSEIYLSELERGEKSASINALTQLAGPLGIKPSEIMRQIEDVLERGPSEPPCKQGRPKKEK